MLGLKSLRDGGSIEEIELVLHNRILVSTHMNTDIGMHTPIFTHHKSE
jgi:hypothetical protein